MSETLSYNENVTTIVLFLFKGTFPQNISRHFFCKSHDPIANLEKIIWRNYGNHTVSLRYNEFNYK